MDASALQDFASSPGLPALPEARGHLVSEPVSLCGGLPQLHAVFQPIVRSVSGVIEGYEGLIRGPAGGALHSPAALFSAARAAGRLAELEMAALDVVTRTFALHGLPGSLFVNVSASVLATHARDMRAAGRRLKSLGLGADRLVIELTEGDRIGDLRQMRGLVDELRSLGFRIALDDLGEGFASLKVWKEIAPDIVKIDRHFIDGVDRDPWKRQFLRAMQDIGHAANTRLVAEGIETVEEFRVVQDLKIALAQGYFIARPAPDPVRIAGAHVTTLARRVTVYPEVAGSYGSGADAGRLATRVVPLTPACTGQQAYDRFAADKLVQALPVIDAGIPVGVISRFGLIDRFARPYWRELFGKKSCVTLMNAAPVVVEASTGVQEIGWRMSSLEADHELAEGIIVVQDGKFLGMCSGLGLLRELSDMQLKAARYANPLTQLPGNVPITQHTERLLEAGLDFCVCHADLDSFKPFNDIYGYRKGDEMIQLVATILSAAADTGGDLVGHIGGDDFIVIFQSADWRARVESALAEFDRARLALFSPADIERGGFAALDRTGQQQFYPLTSLSIGAVVTEGSMMSTAHEVAARAGEAKSQAKKLAGSALFVDRRSACSRLVAAGQLPAAAGSDDQV